MWADDFDASVDYEAGAHHMPAFVNPSVAVTLGSVKGRTDSSCGRSAPLTGHPFDASA